MSSVLKLTPRHLSVYDFIVAFKQDHDGSSPSVLEICKATGVNSTSMVRRYFTTLILLGMINYGGRKSRMISIPGARWLPPLSDFRGIAYSYSSVGGAEDLGTYHFLRSGSGSSIPE